MDERAIHAPALDYPSGAAYHCVMRNARTTVILSIVATILVFGIGACIAIKPLTAIGLAPILAAISLIIRAIRGRPSHRDDPPKHPRHDLAATTAEPCPAADNPTEYDVGAVGAADRVVFLRSNSDPPGDPHERPGFLLAESALPFDKLEITRRAMLSAPPSARGR